MIPCSTQNKQKRNTTKEAYIHFVHAAAVCEIEATNKIGSKKVRESGERSFLIKSETVKSLKS